MSTSPVMSITDELLAEIEAAAESATNMLWDDGGMESALDSSPIYEEDAAFILLVSPVRAYCISCELQALRASIADLKQQLVAAGVTAENCELFRKDAERCRSALILCREVLRVVRPTTQKKFELFSSARTAADEAITGANP